MKDFYRIGIYYKPEGGGAGAGGAGGAADGGAAGGTNKGDGNQRTFDDWYNSLSADDRGLLDAHTTGLKNTVQATREERDTLGKQVKELLGKAEKGSALETQLTAIQSQLDKSNKKATFLEGATSPEIGCTNPRVAYALAVQEDLFDKDGKPEWEKIRMLSPESFQKKKNPDGSAGSGSRGDTSGAALTMDEMIRQKANQRT